MTESSANAAGAEPDGNIEESAKKPPKTLQVIGAGLPRTGTLSTQAALQTLLDGECYHMKTVMGSSAHRDWWYEKYVEPGNYDSYDVGEITLGYIGCVDAPLCYHYEDLMKSYPDAKVVLTVRDNPQVWYASWLTLRKKVNKVRPLSRLPFLKNLRKMVTMSDASRKRHGVFGDEQVCIAAYEAHVAKVKATVPPEKLLVFNVKDGWGPLCDLLDVAVPEEPFPHLNSGGKTLSGMIRKTVLKRE